MDTDMDSQLWKKKAMAFAIRTHRHLWGKNNEDPLAFLFNQGLSNEFAKSIYLGWNKFGQERQYEKWGINRDGGFIIPPGLVFPNIVEKQLLSVFIIPMDGSRVFILPGSDLPPITLGSPNREDLMETRDMIQGLLFFQNHPEKSIRIIF